MQSWQRFSNPLFCEDPPILPTPTPLLFQNLSNPLLLQLPPPLLFLLPCFFDWMRDGTTLDVLFYLMILCSPPFLLLIHNFHAITQSKLGQNVWWYMAYRRSQPISLSFFLVLLHQNVFPMVLQETKHGFRRGMFV